MTIDQSNSDGRSEDTKVERDHPQTRKAEPDARGSSRWRDDVVPPEGADAGEGEEGAELDEGRQLGPESPGRPASELADEDAEAVRRQAAGAGTVGNALGSGTGRDIGSGTRPDRGELGGGEPKAEEGTGTPAGARSPGGDSRG